MVMYLRFYIIVHIVSHDDDLKYLRQENGSSSK